MHRTRLSGKVGAALDPCAALQVAFDLADGQERELENGQHLVVRVRPGAERRFLLTGHMDTLPPDDLRSRAIQRLTSDPAIDTAPSFSPDGRQITFESDRGGSQQIYTMNADGTGLNNLTRHKGQDNFAAWAPDGKTIVSTDHSETLRLWDVATGTQIGPQLTAGDRRTMIDLSSDGRQMLEVHGNGQGAVWDVDPESWKRRACALAASGNRQIDAREPHDAVAVDHLARQAFGGNHAIGDVGDDLKALLAQLAPEDVARFVSR